MNMPIIWTTISFSSWIINNYILILSIISILSISWYFNHIINFVANRYICTKMQIILFLLKILSSLTSIPISLFSMLIWFSSVIINSFLRIFNSTNISFLRCIIYSLQKYLYPIIIVLFNSYLLIKLIVFDRKEWLMMIINFFLNEW